VDRDRRSLRAPTQGLSLELIPLFDRKTPQTVL
jgi:hypothetical protein